VATCTGCACIAVELWPKNMKVCRCMNVLRGKWFGRVVGNPFPAEIETPAILRPAWCEGKEDEMGAIEKIEAQQKGKEHSPAWMIGEQLKNICRAEPHSEELVDIDLDHKSMSLEECEKKLKAYADEQHKKNKGNCVCVSPAEAEKIIREFYGLEETSRCPAEPTAVPQKNGQRLNLSDFL